MLTGKFQANRWLLAHVRPLALAKEVEEVIVISDQPLIPLEKVRYLPPPALFQKFFGATLSRYLWFIYSSVRLRPQMVGGFHLLMNGLIALVVARVVRAKSIYFCVGGKTEVIGGGARGENRLFGMMGSDQPQIEQSLLWLIAHFDMVITMGSGARDYFKTHGISNRVEILPGGIDPSEFIITPNESRTYDIVGVFRLVPVKRPDVFINVIAQVAQRYPGLRATIIGDGRMMSDLRKQTREKGLDRRLEFVGHQEDIPVWLSKSKTFLLTSDSEGVALSVMEALAAGTPVVASDVGDLADVVVNGDNGFLTPRRQVQGYAEKLSLLLGDPSLRATFAQRAVTSAAAFSIEATTCRWNEMLHSIR